MKTVIVIESVGELFAMASRTRAKEDTSPMLPLNSRLVVFKDGSVDILAEGFKLGFSPKITDILKELMYGTGLQLSING